MYNNTLIIIYLYDICNVSVYLLFYLEMVCYFLLRLVINIYSLKYTLSFFLLAEPMHIDVF